MKEQTLTSENIGQKYPPWIRGRISVNKNFLTIQNLLQKKNLNTVCVEAACPNKGECWGARHVTFMILGKNCTRKCLFCNVAGGIPEKIDFQETKRIADALKEISAKYVVITSVTRDDLPDRGVDQFLNMVKEIKSAMPKTKIELLIPDFDAKKTFLNKIAFSGAEIIGHNIEMPRALYPIIRPEADYNVSIKAIKLLNQAKNEGAPILVKSSIMVGLGETKDDVFETFKNLKNAGIDILYIGQYLSPSPKHWPVKKYYTPEEFKFFEKKAYEMGFSAVCSGPLVRSSYI
ncbi:MAG: lipoyl synthase [Candidatus Omnitrophota bacterium]